jgi:eukaryotic-like serine/threonine-protein kinase
VSDESGARESDSDSFDALLARAARLSPAPTTHVANALQLHPGALLGGGRFRLLRRLGAGGMGVVFEALDQERATEVAVKTLTRLDAHGIYRLKNEFRALADVLHPNLVRLHDLIGDEQLWLFSMELVRGSELDTWVRPSGAFDLERVRSAFSQLARGVRAIHAAGLLHRDLKPSNVLVEACSGRVVILDFGLVSDPERGGRGQTRDTNVSGTPHYMAPELIAGAAASVASDAYALGVMLFEALTGRLPFDGRVFSIMQRKQSEPAPRAKSLVPELPDELDALCAALLERDPSARPDVDGILRALGAEPTSDLAADAARASQPTAAPGRVERTVLGRGAELALLRECYTAARLGTPTLVHVCGESGIGKSALVEAFLQELHSEAPAIALSGRCYERENVPYKAFDRVIDDLTRHLRSLSDVDAASLLPRDIGSLALAFPVLARTGAIAKRSARPAQDANEQRRRAFGALAELLARIRDREPLVIYVDDLHWLDLDSTLLFEHLFSEPEPPPFLFVVTGRSDGDASLTTRVLDAAKQNRRMSVHELALGPLSEAAAHKLAALLLGESAAVASVAQESAGNPFFVGELARASRRRHDERGRAGEHAERESANVSLEQTLRERAALLGDDANALLSVLALCGRPVPADVLVRAAGPCDDPHRALDALRGAHLIRETGQRHYDCYHDRIRAAVSGGLTELGSRLLHRQLAQAWDERGQADPEILYAHWLAAGQPERAGRHAVAAAEKASTSLAFARAAALLAHAIELLPRDEVDRLGLRARRAEALSCAGRWTEAAHAYGEAGDHAAGAPEREELAFFSALHFLGSGHGDAGMPLLRALFESAGVRWPRTRTGAFVSGMLRLGWVLLRAGSARKRRERARKVGQLPDVFDLTRWLGGASFVPVYDLARGLYFMSVFISRALRSGDDAFAGVALAMLSALLSGSKHTRERARAYGRRAVELARSHTHEAIASAALSCVAYASLLDGRPGATLALGLEAERFAQARGHGPAYPAWAARAAQAYGLLWMGRLGECARVFAENARFARDNGNPLAEIGGDCALRHLATGDLASAHALMDRKARVLDALGASGMLRELADRERIFCLLYEGRGAEAADRFVDRAQLLAIFDPGMPLACAALQADPHGALPRTRKVLARTLARLRAQGDFASAEAMAAQLMAARCLFDDQVQGALIYLERAAQRYAAAEMALHALLVRRRIAELRDDAADVLATEQAVRELGIAEPRAWANMLSPGLTRRAQR